MKEGGRRNIKGEIQNAGASTQCSLYLWNDVLRSLLVKQIGRSHRLKGVLLVTPCFHDIPSACARIDRLANLVRPNKQIEVIGPLWFGRDMDIL